MNAKKNNLFQSFSVFNIENDYKEGDTVLSKTNIPEGFSGSVSVVLKNHKPPKVKHFVVYLEGEVDLKDVLESEEKIVIQRKKEIKNESS